MFSTALQKFRVHNPSEVANKIIIHKQTKKPKQQNQLQQNQNQEDAKITQWLNFACQSVTLTLPLHRAENYDTPNVTFQDL